MKTAARRGLRLAIGIALGAITGVVEMAFTLLTGVVLLPVQAWPRGFRAVLRPVGSAGRWLAERERHRLSACLRITCSPAYTDERALTYIAVRWPLGLLGGLVLLCALIGAAYVLFLLVGSMVADVHHPADVVMAGSAGLLLLFLSVQGAVGVRALEGRVARRFLGPSQQEQLRRRIDQLFSSRAGIVEAVHDERRRIERDLHDGVQQRLVALGMLLGRALRSQDRHHIDELLSQAHRESQQALTDLREVAWRVYPTALDQGGLKAAVETVAERSAVPVSLEFGIAEEPRGPIAAVAYFVVSEAITNTVKHTQATRIRVMIEDKEDGSLRVSVEDDGAGGADPGGSGLIGLARRVAALDGRLEVHSPAGGPTVITAELPCD
ncbi:sensor histidine kinase [Streptomyces sp. TS71-3]|uniref:sensor histidine kinase n=1 Tax=Streptomyces sp. TS71-3 TaxID=2733862 RepID=UPI001B00340F|nr:histidine kinase [Streptomyces sp. TS71-3]GHJ37917.1 ATPase [Streptomyces sp. TS71-3]